MAASSNSSLSGSSVSSGKFLRRAPHFSPPSILAGSYLSAERLAVPLVPAPRQALPQPRAGAPPGRRCPCPGSAVPQAAPKGGSRDWGSAAGPGSPPRRLAVPLCGVRERGAPRPAPSPGEQHPCWLGKGRGTGSSRGGARGEQGIQRQTRIPCRGPRCTGPGPASRPGASWCSGAGAGCQACHSVSVVANLAFSVVLQDWEQLNSRSRLKNAPGDGVPQGFGRGCEGLVRALGFGSAGWEAVRSGALPRSR